MPPLMTDPYTCLRRVKIFWGKAPGELSQVAAVMSYMVDRGTWPGLFFVFSDGWFLNQGVVCGCCSISPVSDGPHLYFVLWPQFSNRGSNDRSTARNIGHPYQMLGRWASAAYTLYIRTPSVSASMAQSRWPPCLLFSNCGFS